jgi:hypothetical protein
MQSAFTEGSARERNDAGEARHSEADGAAFQGEGAIIGTEIPSAEDANG